ncbi:MAG: hypothetical protein ABR543_04340 [Gemmatimonadaceae bacterium]
MTGVWEGQTWLGAASAFLIDGGAAVDTLFVFGSRPIGGNDEAVQLRIILHGPGPYDLDAGDARLDELIGGDVVSASYQTAQPGAGHVILSSFSGGGEIVEGTFRFEARTTSPYGSYGTTGRFEEGQFSAKVQVPRP